MLNVEKVISFNQKSENNTKGFNTDVYDQIMRFLRGHRRESKNTSNAYERDIRQFFLIKKGKKIEHLTKEDLIFTIEEFEDYQDYLIDTLKVSVSTANRHIVSISECMRHLYKRGLIKDIVFLDIKRPTAIPDSYDELTSEEIDRISEFVLRTGRKKTGEIKRMLIRFSYDTCMRQEECLNLKWTDFGEVKDNNMVPVRTIAKGNKVMRREISLEIYEELLYLREIGDIKVFNIGTTTISRMMDDIRNHLNIDPAKRKIVFHSIRKAGAQFLWEWTRDINQVSQALGHASIQTTELYINKNENYGVVGALSLKQNLNSGLFEKVSHEDLLTAIKSLGKDKQMFINLKLQELIGK